jgi:hypothetical protein
MVMSRVQFIAGQLSDLPLTGRAFAAIDLGFGASKSCGIVVRRMDDSPKPILLSFGGCVTHVASLISEGTISSLIVEAPLSGIFNEDGDPQWRCPFERQPGSDKTLRRYWYTQPGSTVCLAAIAFFSRLSQAIPPCEKSVHVFEGFFTFKPKGKSDHCYDAVRLAEAARDASVGHYYEVVAPKGGQLLTVLSVVGATESGERAPAVIACKAERAEPGAIRATGAANTNARS